MALASAEGTTSNSMGLSVVPTRGSAFVLVIVVSTVETVHAASTIDTSNWFIRPRLTGQPGMVAVTADMPTPLANHAGYRD